MSHSLNIYFWNDRPSFLIKYIHFAKENHYKYCRTSLIKKFQTQTKGDPFNYIFELSITPFFLFQTLSRTTYRAFVHIITHLDMVHNIIEILNVLLHFWKKNQSLKGIKYVETIWLKIFYTRPTVEVTLCLIWPNLTESQFPNLGICLSYRNVLISSAK